MNLSIIKGTDMTPLLRGAIIILLGAVAVCAAGPAGDSWKKTGETRDGIVIHTRVMPGSRVRELRANCIMEAAPMHVWQAVLDRETYRDSAKYVKIDRVFRTENEDVWYNYQLLEAPMLDRRDYTLRYESRRDPGRMQYRLDWRAVNDFGPAPGKGVVRLAVCDGSFEIEPREGGKKAFVTYWVCVDPGGQVPAWAANLANRSSLPDFLRAVRKQSYKFRDRAGQADEK